MIKVNDIFTVDHFNPPVEIRVNAVEDKGEFSILKCTVIANPNEAYPSGGTITTRCDLIKKQGWKIKG